MSIISTTCYLVIKTYTIEQDLIIKFSLLEYISSAENTGKASV